MMKICRMRVYILELLKLTVSLQGRNSEELVSISYQCKKKCNLKNSLTFTFFKKERKMHISFPSASYTSRNLKPNILLHLAHTSLSQVCLFCFLFVSWYTQFNGIFCMCECNRLLSKGGKHLRNHPCSSMSFHYYSILVFNYSLS